jgi:hypothetical protein
MDECASLTLKEKSDEPKFAAIDITSTLPDAGVLLAGVALIVGCM